MLEQLSHLGKRILAVGAGSVWLGTGAMLREETVMLDTDQVQAIDAALHSPMYEVRSISLTYTHVATDGKPGYLSRMTVPVAPPATRLLPTQQHWPVQLQARREMHQSNQSHVVLATGSNDRRWQPGGSAAGAAQQDGWYVYPAEYMVKANRNWHVTTRPSVYACAIFGPLFAVRALVSKLDPFE